MGSWSGCDFNDNNNNNNKIIIIIIIIIIKTVFQEATRLTCQSSTCYTN